MRKMIRSQRGFTIMELMVSVVMYGFLMAVAATGFSAFFAKFDELTAVSDLQKGAFECLMTIKNGIGMKALDSSSGATTYQFKGVNNADSVIFMGVSAYAFTGSSIRLFPNVTDVYHQNDYIQFYTDGKYVRAKYLDGSIQPASPLYIFPKPGRQNRTEVTKLKFTMSNSGLVPRVIKVELEARVKLKNNTYRSIAYTTQMALQSKM